MYIDIIFSIFAGEESTSFLIFDIICVTILSTVCSFCFLANFLIIDIYSLNTHSSP